jgi:hypothetical protein
MSHACTINVSRSIIDNSGSINCKSIVIVSYICRVIKMMPQLGASITDNARSIIYHHNMFIMQATGLANWIGSQNYVTRGQTLANRMKPMFVER